MPKDERDILDLLKFELQFLEDGGYGRSVRTPWRSPWIFEDSPTCLNFDDPKRLRPCKDCALMDFVPQERQRAAVPCRFIELNAAGQTLQSLYRWGTDEEREGALRNWLRTTIHKLEQERRISS